MASNSNQLAEKLEDRASSPAPAGQQTLREALSARKDEFQAALGKSMDVDRFLRIVLTTCRTTPKLMSCSFESIMAAVLQCAQLKLEPGPLGEVYLIPRKGQCSFEIGYRGYVSLLSRAGVSVIARKVCANDEFDFWTDEDGDHLRHKPKLTDRGEIVCYYGLARLPGGHRVAHVMTLADIDRHRKRSQNPDSGPWRDDRDAMSAKTVILSMERWLPKSVEMADVLAIEDTYRESPSLMVPPDSVQPAVPDERRIELTEYIPDVANAQGVEHFDDEPEGVWDDPDVAVPADEKESLL